MTHVIKNVRNHDVTVDGVAINPGEQLTLHTISAGMQAAIDRGDLMLRSGDETFEERKANVESYKGA